MDNGVNKLRTSAIGGFNKKDVITYIEKIKNEHYKYKFQIEKTVKELNDQVSELKAAAERAVKEKENLIKQLSEHQDTDSYVQADNERHDTVSEINEATTHLKNVADELCRSLRDFMDKISENSVAVVLEGAEDEDEEAFDGEKLLAEFESEILAMFGPGESADKSEISELITETYDEEDKEPPVETVRDDKVSSILSSVSSFSSYEKVEMAKDAEITEKKDETVSNILGSLSFLK